MRAAWWWIDRWQKSTAYKDMTLTEQGGYRNLLDELWLRDGLLPLDERILARLCGDPLEWAKIRSVVLARFTKTDAGYRHETHDEVAAQSKSFRDAQAEAGRARALRAKRDKNGRLQPASPAGKSSQSQPEVQPEVQPENQPENQPPSPSPSPSPSPDQSPSPSSVPTERAADKPPRSPKPRRQPSGPHADCIRAWEAEWARTRLGQSWAWQPKDAALMAKALRLAGGDPQEVQARTSRLLESGDAWLAANASPGILVSRWNQLAVTVEANGTAGLLSRLLAQTENS